MKLKKIHFLQKYKLEILLIIFYSILIYLGISVFMM
jgi:hypothetical protein